MTAEQALVPIVTIGGHLGAGKTTLVNHLLTHAGGRRIVVFVNDFGDINIDTELIDTVVEDRISLTNGCVCCSLSDDLISGIVGFSRGSEPPDVIAIEMSGVADPRALDASLSTLEAAGAARLDTRLYVVDCDCFDGLAFEEKELVIDGAAASDIVLLNKSDLAEADKMRSTTTLMTEACPLSTLIETRNCSLPVELLFVPGVERRREEGRPRARTDHARDYATWSGATDEPVVRKAFDRFASVLMEHCIRAKGVVCFAETPEIAFAFHLVGRRATLERLPRFTVRPSTKLVAIGKAGALDHQRLSAMFETLSG